jgi:hypothetical protein
MHPTASALRGLPGYDAAVAELDPTITGALIAGGAAIIGFAASGWSTRATVRAGRDVARDQRLWLKKSALYEALNRVVRDLDVSKASASELEKVYAALLDLRDRADMYAGADVQLRYGILRRQIRILIENSVLPNQVLSQLREDAAGSVGRLRLSVRSEIQQDRPASDLFADGLITRLPWGEKRSRRRTARALYLLDAGENESAAEPE